MLAGLVAAVALAGYGDPVDGRPSAGERAVHLWIDAARAAPEAWTDDYAAGGCSVGDFTAGERAFHTPLAWLPDLGAVARAHAEDMDAHDDLDHTSSDGTPWDERLGAVYGPSTIGETIAYDPGGPRHAVLSTWMCSPPHRAILTGDYDEIGAGVSGPYYTVDVGLAGHSGWPPIPSAAHEPPEPTTEVPIRAVWFGSDPDAVRVVLDGEAHAMDLVAGAPDAGLYARTLPTDAACHTWWIEAAFADDVAIWPEEGRYGWGDCAWDDAGARWMSGRPSDGPTGDAGEDRGCATAPGGSWLLALFAAAAIRTSRARA